MVPIARHWDDEFLGWPDWSSEIVRHSWPPEECRNDPSLLVFHTWTHRRPQKARHDTPEEPPTFLPRLVFR